MLNIIRKRLFNAASSAGSAVVSGTLNYLAKFTTDGSTVDDSSIFDNGSKVAIGTATVSPGLGKLRVYDTSVNVDLGEVATGEAALWLDASTPSTTNWSVKSDGTQTYINTPSGTGGVLFTQFGNTGSSRSSCWSLYI